MTQEAATRKPSYVFPLRLLLQNLVITQSDLRREKITVSTKYLRKLLGNSILQEPINEKAYLEENPDVQAAILAGDIVSGNEHFKNSGYFEGRLLGRLPFDAKWYRAKYRDIEATFAPNQEDEMYQHYVKTGYFEGRVGSAEEVAELAKWHDE